MKAIRLKIKPDSDITTLDVGRTIRASQIPEDVSGTLIDPEVLKTGCRINFPKDVTVPDAFGRMIRFIQVPSLSPDGRVEKSGEMVFLHPITVAANQLLAYFEQTEGNIDIRNVERLVKLFYWSLIDRVTGHRGVVATNVSGTRMAHSGRLVLIPQIDREPEWVGISAHAMERAKIKEGDLVIVFRDPVIWVGSMEVLKAYPVQEDVIKLHPLLFKQMGADCDGDQVAFVKPPEDEGVKEEMQENLLRHCKQHAKWPKHLCPGGLSEKPDWDNIVEDTRKRFVVSGMSYGPGDVRGWSKVPANVQQLEELLNKPGRALRNRDISKDPEIRKQIMLETNYANLFMKGYLGVVGATARRLLLVMGEDNWLKAAVNRCSEKIQQDTLDSKHHVGEAKRASPIDIMEMFERRGTWKTSSTENCVELLVKAGLTEEDSRRIILHFRVEIPLQLFVEVNLPEKKVYYFDKIRSLIMDDNGNARTKVNIRAVLDEIAVDLSKKLDKKIGISSVLEEIKNQYSVGLTNLIDMHYPGAALIHKSTSSDMDRAVAFYKHVFHQKREDRGSLFKHLWEVG